MFDYIEKYGNISFDDSPFNEVDNVILSVVMYLDFTGIVSNKNKIKSLKLAGFEYLHTHDKKAVSKLGIAQRDAYHLMEILIDKERYQDIKLSNYRYITSLDTQFSAMVFTINKHLKYIGFEGTDEYLSGWKEDAYLSCKFPVDGQRYAIDYINEVVKLFSSDIIIGGHSKGGNFALVSAMYSKFYIKNKIKLVYSNDGPGLRKEEFNSKYYNNIKNKYIHIVPDYSLVGILLNNDNYYVIKSSKKNILAHSASTWLIQDNYFIKSSLSETSKKMDKLLDEYLSRIPYDVQVNVIDTVFNSLEKMGLKTVLDIINFKAINDVIKSLKIIDKDTKDTLIEIIEILIKNYI